MSSEPTAQQPAEAGTRHPFIAFLRARLPLIALALIIIVFGGFLASRQPLFLTPGTLGYIFKYYSPMAMLALGMTFVILTGGIDLSVGFGMMLLMFVMAGVARDHPGTGAVVLLATGICAAIAGGGIIGGAVAFGRIPSFVVSLAVMVAAYGVTLIISQNQSISNLPPTLLWLGGTEFSLFGTTFPLMMPVVILCYVLGAILLGKTSFGRHLYAVGSNREAARLSGINVRKTELAAYLLSWMCVWIAAWMQIGINRNADPKVALSDNLELNAIAIVVIGGTSLTGGRGGVAGTALGAMLLSMIFYGLPLIGINEPSYKKLIQGGIIMLGAILDAVQRRFAKG